MKILLWNVMGMANPNTKSELANLCFTYSLDYLCIFEPMVSLSSIHSAFWNSIRMKFVCSNDRGDLAPNIRVLVMLIYFGYRSSLHIYASLS